MSYAIELDSLSKIYRPTNGRPAVQALHDLSLSIRSGQVMGLVGQAGAGKTSALKLIAGQVKPTAGHVRVNGWDTTSQTQAARHQVCALLGSRFTPWTPLIPTPPIIVMDEPALPANRPAIKRWLQDLAEQHHKTVVVATRSLDIARDLCQQVAVLAHGHLAAVREARFLEERFLGIAYYHIRVKGHLAQTWANWFEGLSLTTHDDGSMVIAGPIVDQAALYGVLAKVRDLGLPLISVTSEDLTGLRSDL